MLSYSRNKYETNSTYDLFKTFSKPGVLYEDILFVIDEYKPDVFDPATKAWSNWPKPINQTSIGSCMVVYNKKFYVFGGIQVYTKKTIEILKSRAVFPNL